MPFANEKSAPPLLAERLSFRYASEPVLNNASLRLNRGDFAGIIGANGAGKSTLLRLLFGEIQLGDGKIEWFGENIDRFSSWTRIGYLPQNAAPESGAFPATAREIILANLHSDIGLFRPASKRHREAATQALADMGAAELAERMIGEMSGGQRQRVFLARALVTEPEVLVLDEPTAGIDAEAADSLFELLSRINRERSLTILMVTHDIARVGKYAERLFFLEDGRLMECGDDFHRHPPHSHGE